MTRSLPAPRPRPRSLRSGALFFLVAGALAVLPAAAGAQERPPPAPPADTTEPAGPPAQDTLLPPPPSLPDLPPPPLAGWELGVWEWTREDLLMLADLAVLDLLERIPGITPVRAGIYGQPEGAAVLGTAAAGVRYVLDGFELDPLTERTFDPARIPLLALARLRVERGVTGAVVHLETLSPTDPRTHTVVEAATGDGDVNLFRGIFLSPGVLGGPLALGFERLSARSAGGSNLTTGWLKWSFVRDSAGVRLEYRQTETDRSGSAGDLLGTRADWALRARARPFGVPVEAFAGATTIEDDDGILVLREGTPQAALRVRSPGPGPFGSGARAALRWRDHPRLPGLQADVEAWAAPRPWLTAAFTLTRGWWAAHDATTTTALRGRLGPLLGLSLLAEVDRGEPAARLLTPGDSVLLAPTRQGVRLGASFERWGVRAGAAALRIRADQATGFGTPYDDALPTLVGGETTGFEALVDLPTAWEPLRLDGWFVSLESTGAALYLPEHQWRAALVYRHSPLPSGNLEIHARAEHVYRGRMNAPCTPILACEEAAPADGLVPVGSYRATNIDLTIRVVTVRAFVRWENAFNRRFQQDLPFGYPAEPGTSPARLSLPGQHFVYGVKWEFLN